MDRKLLPQEPEQRYEVGVWPKGITERRTGAEWDRRCDRAFDLGDDMGSVHPREAVELSKTLERFVVMFAGEP